MSAGAAPAGASRVPPVTVSRARAADPGSRPPRASICPMTPVPATRLLRAAGAAVAAALVAGCGASTEVADAAATAAASLSATAGTSPASTAAAGSTAAGAPSTSSAVVEPAPTVSPAGTTPAGTAPATAAPADTSADVADAVDPDGLTVTAVRAARHEGHDRVVFELSGSGTPGWRAEYVQTPAAQGTGDEVDVPGAVALQVTLQGVAYPYETGAAEVARGPMAISGTQHVAGVVYDGTFEGAAVAWIGTDGRAPFRVYSLTGPSRVVVEVVDAG